MADKQRGSIYDRYWNMIKECRKKRGAIVELTIPVEQQAKVIKAIRKRKWKDQYDNCTDYGQLFVVVVCQQHGLRYGHAAGQCRTCGTDDFINVRFQLVPPAINRI